MSTIFSPVSAVNQLRVEPFPTNRQIRGARMVRVGRVICAVDEKGCFYSTQVEKGCAYSFGINLEETLTGAKRLGLLSKDAVDEHIKLVTESHVRRERCYAAERFKNAAFTLGLKLTNAQQGAIARAANGMD